MSAEPFASVRTPIDDMAELIRQKIISGEFSSGQHLSEVALSESSGIFRNTLREVFRLLTKEGLLGHEPHCSVSVATPSIASIVDMCRVRRLNECQALAHAYPSHMAKKHLREAVDASQRCRDVAD